jgi:hypothetical protein
MVKKVKTTKLPFNPHGRNAVFSFIKETLTESEMDHALKFGHLAPGARTFHMNLFREWLFREYSAEVVKNQHKWEIRFVDDDSVMMFLLKY